jgi:hypothetical protein
MYTERNFKSKKELREAIARGEIVRVYQPNDMFGVNETIQTGEHQVSLEGPHFPQPHKWYARAVVRDGRVVSVR